MKTKLTFLLFFTAFCASSNDSTPLNLRYEPIQPLVKSQNIDLKKAKLGKRLFNESRLSRNNDLSCASCHILNKNGANNRALAKGNNNTHLNANTLTVFNSSLNHQQFWDGRAPTQEAQIDFVINGEKEFSNTWKQVILTLKNDKSYRDIFNTIYSDGINADNVRNAIVTFEKTLITTNSRFDQYLLGDVNAISSQEKKGYRLFKSYGCVACHQGSNVGGNMFMKFGLFDDYYQQNNNNHEYLGRYNISKKESDRYVFRVPSLRLVTITAPYFHDGSVKTLAEAIKIMAKYQLGRSINEQHVNDIIAFLKTLPGDYLGQSLYEKHRNHIGTP
jgi:cytochrome c peroxidase